MAKRYYWLKLPDGFFRQKAIKKLRKIAGGDTYTIIYLKMLLVAMKQDGRLPEKVPTARQWKKAKLRCLESIMRKFAFEPDTKVGPLSLSMGERAKLWKEMYEDLKKDLKASAASAEAILPLAENPETGRITPPYFYAGMMSHEETEGEDI